MKLDTKPEKISKVNASALPDINEILTDKPIAKMLKKHLIALIALSILLLVVISLSVLFYVQKNQLSTDLKQSKQNLRDINIELDKTSSDLREANASLEQTENNLELTKKNLSVSKKSLALTEQSLKIKKDELSTASLKLKGAEKVISNAGQIIRLDNQIQDLIGENYRLLSEAIQWLNAGYEDTANEKLAELYENKRQMASLVAQREKIINNPDLSL